MIYVIVAAFFGCCAISLLTGKPHGFIAALIGAVIYGGLFWLL